VTSLADSGPGTLRAAIAQADQDTTPDTITFAPGVTGTIALLTALPGLSRAITIAGPGSSVLTVARSAAPGTPDFRIFAVPAGADVTISGLTVSRGFGNGGGIYNAGTLTVSGSRLSGNGAPGHGGGIYNAGTLAVTDSTLSDNSAGGGGGISNAGTLTVTNSTLSGNSAFDGGGGIYNAGTLAVTDSTLSGNSVEGSELFLFGGGIFNAGTLTVTASIFANNIGGSLGLSFGAIVSKGHNLFSDSPFGALNPTDLTDTNPLLGPLADNGGPTQTMALLPGSLAIDAGVAVPGVSTDQRGVPRPQGRAPDIGSFESRGFTLAVVSGAGQTAPVNSPFPAPLVVSVTSAFGEPVAGGRVTFTAPRPAPPPGSPAAPRPSAPAAGPASPPRPTASAAPMPSPPGRPAPAASR
jgi:hypothetical protein